jgi:hypothetical protein
MKDIYKNPILYYIAVPVIIGLWPILICTLYLPNAERNLLLNTDQYNDANDIMLQIVALDPGRLDFADSNDIDVEFTYDRAVEMVAALCGIPPSKYNLNSQMLITSKEQKSQNANVDLKQIDIVRFTRFLSTIQLRWPDLQCQRVKLIQNEGLPDMWEADIEFKYYY